MQRVKKYLNGNKGVNHYLTHDMGHDMGHVFIGKYKSLLENVFCTLIR